MDYLFFLTILFKHRVEQSIHAFGLVQTKHVFSMSLIIPISLIFRGVFEGVILGTCLAYIERHI